VLVKNENERVISQEGSASFVLRLVLRSGEDLCVIARLLRNESAFSLNF